MAMMMRYMMDALVGVHLKARHPRPESAEKLNEYSYTADINHKNPRSTTSQIRARAAPLERGARCGD